jgi:hypothetical protein
MCECGDHQPEGSTDTAVEENNLNQNMISFKGKQADVREIAEKLGVNYVLEGSVRRRYRLTRPLRSRKSGWRMRTACSR